MRKRILIVAGVLGCFALVLMATGRGLRLTPGGQLHAAPMPASSPQHEWAPPPGAVESSLRPYLPAGQPVAMAPLIQPEISLPPEKPVVKLNSVEEKKVVPVAADFPLLPPEPPLDLVPSPIREPELIGPPAVVVSDDSPMMVEPLIPPARLVSDPLITNTQPEEITMKSIKWAIMAIAGSALMASPMNAIDPKDDVAKSLERLEAAIAKLESVEKGLTDYKTSNAAAMRQVQIDLESLKARMQKLEDDQKNGKQVAINPDSTSKRDAMDSASKLGTIELKNEFVQEYSVLVNKKSYRMPPGTKRELKVPAGPFTYQILGLQFEEQLREIAAGEVKPIRIYTLPGE